MVKIIDLFENLSDENIQKYRDIIIRDCQPFLRESKHALFRGSDSAVYSFFLKKKKVRKRRRPMDSPTALHRKVNKAMKELGFEARRNNSIFTIKSPGAASGYGDIYCVFPIGEYNYTYSNSIEDFYNYFRSENILNILTDKSIDTFMSLKDEYIIDIIESSDINYQALVKFIKKNYSNTKLNSAKRNTEIMINCESYYLLAAPIYASEYDYKPQIKLIKNLGLKILS